MRLQDANIAGKRTLLVARFIGVLGIIAGVTAVYSLLISANTTTVALSLLLSVLGIAAKWGLAEAVTASVAGVLCFNFFFLPPTGTWTIEDPENWVALGAFLVTAVVGSQLSANIRRRATEAVQRQTEMERLYSLSCAMMLADSWHDMGQQVVALIAEIFEAQGVALYDRTKNRIYRAGLTDVQVEESKLCDAAMQNISSQDPFTGMFVCSLKLGGDPIGSLGICGTSVSSTALQSIANLAAIALERTHSLEAASRAEAARQSEELKSTLLDALAHEFKTPLTSIKAAATGLLSAAELSPTQEELLKVIDEETDRLNSMVTEAVQVARIEAGDVSIDPVSTQISELVEHGLTRLGATLQEHPVEIEIPRDLPPVSVDRDLILIVFAHLLDNAVKYSAAGTPIRVSVSLDDSSIVVSVCDGGPGIEQQDRERIFERFYRGEATKYQVLGTGMGLAIAREIIKLHGGSIWVENLPQRGACFSFRLPTS